jgi:hypothetical protein
VDRSAVERWLAGYEELWRTPGTDRLGELFTTDISYSPSPWATPLEGLDALAVFWDAERVSPEERFDLRAEIIAVDVRTTTGNRWRDLWIIDFADDGRCRAFVEWPFAPDRPDGH